MNLKNVLRVKDVQEIWSVGRTKASELFNDFIIEVQRKDAKIPKECFIEIGDKLKWVNADAFYYFMLNYDNLQDLTKRASVKKFNKQELGHIL